MTHPAPARAPDSVRHSYVPGAHIPTLDGLRGLAILLVIFRHTGGAMAPTMPTGEAVLRVVRTGWIGVDLFFVLSGFLITGILVDSLGRPGYFRNFIARRSLRIFPLYYGFLIVTILILPLIASDRLAGLPALVDQQAWFWTYMVNFLVARDGFGATPLGTSVLWSLAVEEQFYLIWPTIVLWCGRRHLAKACVGMIAGAALFRVGLLWFGGNFGVDAAYVLTPARMDTFAFGGLAALAVRDDRWRSYAAQLARPAAAVLGGLLLILFLGEGELSRSDRSMQSAGYTLLAALATALLLAAMFAPAGSRTHRLFTAAPLLTLGKYSYAIYVFHLPLQNAYLRLLGTEEIPRVLGTMVMGHLVFSTVITVASLVLAWLSWHLYEKHFLALKRFFPSGGPPTPTSGRSITPRAPAVWGRPPQSVGGDSPAR